MKYSVSRSLLVLDSVLPGLPQYSYFRVITDIGGNFLRHVAGTVPPYNHPPVCIVRYRVQVETVHQPSLWYICAPLFTNKFKRLPSQAMGPPVHLSDWTCWLCQSLKYILALVHLLTSDPWKICVNHRSSCHHYCPFTMFSWGTICT